MIRKHLRVKRIALGLAFAAIVVPTAQATPYGHGIGSAAASEPTVQVSAYELGSGRATHIVPNGMTLENSRPASPVSVARPTSSNGFDWSNTVIAALAAAGTALVLLTVTIVGRRRRALASA